MATKQMDIRVFLVDDQPLFSLGLKGMLNDSPGITVVGTVSNGQEAINRLDESSDDVDVILMDIRMPVMNGIEAVKQVSKKYPKLKCIMLTMYDDDEHILQSFRNGAKAYLTKDDHPEDLSRVIGLVHNYGCFVTPKQLKLLTRVSPLLMDKYGSENIVLTPREKKVLKMITKEFSTKEIATEMELSDRTIESCRVRLMQKTGTKNNVGLTMYAIKHGLV